jgi:hypothetical protein
MVRLIGLKTAAMAIKMTLAKPEVFVLQFTIKYRFLTWNDMV